MANAQAKYVIKLEDKTKRAFKAIGKSLRRTTSAVFSMRTGFVSAAGIAGIGYFVKKSLDATDSMAKMSRTIGVSVEDLQRLRHAASLGGLEATQLDKAVQKLAVNMADMSKGIGLAKDVFEKYNISVENSDGTLRSVVDVMADVADVTSGLTNKTEKADLAYKLFGARGGKMINVLEGGSKGMREAMIEAEKLGLVMSEKTAKGVEEANDAMTRLGSYLGASFHRAVAELAPMLKDITDQMRAWVEMKVNEGGGIGAVAKNMAISVLNAVDKIIGAIEYMANSFIRIMKTMSDLNPFSDSIEDIEDDIKSFANTIKNLEALEGWNDKLTPTGKQHASYTKQKEAAEASLKALRQFEGITPVDFSDSRESIYGYIKAISDAGEASAGLGGDGGGDGGGGKKKTVEKTVWDKMKAGFEDYKETVEKGSLGIATITKKIMTTTEDAIVNMMMGIKSDWKALARSILADIMRLIIRKSILTASSGIGGLLGFAKGGRPPVGVPSIVGERGAELFVPDSAGTIVPNNQLGGAAESNVNVSFNITANDTKGFDGLLESRRGMIVGIINQAMNDRGVIGVTA